MGIPKLVKSDSGVFYATWSENRRSKRRSMKTSDQAEAQRAFAKWLLLGGPAHVAPKSLTVADCWTVYDAKHVGQTAAPETALLAWKTLGPHFGRLKVEDVTGAVEGYVAARSATVKASTIRRELAVLRACLRWCADGARRRPLIAAAPPIALPPEGEARDRWLTTAEIDRLLAAAQEDTAEARLFLLLALETGGRKQALLDLTWDRVDLDTKVIHLRDPGRIETKKRRASVPISDRLLPVLQEAKGEGPVFSGFDPYYAVQRIARRAGVADVSPHVLRHTAATHMARRGVPLWLIAKVLGNSLAMVEKVYAKHSPEDLRAAVNMISGEIGA